MTDAEGPEVVEAIEREVREARAGGFDIDATLDADISIASVAGIVMGRWRLRRVLSGRWFQGQRSPRLKLTASKGRTCTGSSSFAVANSTHSPSRSSKASKVRSIGSTSHRCGTSSRA